MVNKIRQVRKPLANGQVAKCKYNAVCTLAKLFECEIQVMKKIQRQITKFHSRQKTDQQIDLQIAQLYQALDMGNNGRLSRKQIKGILAASTSSKDFVQDTDINAIMRRMDADGDEELSFSDFFTSLLPYFIFGDLKQPPTTNQLAEKVIKRKDSVDKRHIKILNVSVKRAQSFSAAQRQKPPHG